MRGLAVAGDAEVTALLPYLCVDEDKGIVSTAALDYCLLHPLRRNDPLTGPKLLLRLVRDGALSNRGAAIAGMLMLGDGRVMRLLRGVRRQLTTEEIATLAQCTSGYLFAATIDFYVTWLEQLQRRYDEAVFGIICAALCNLVQSASEPVVRSIERVFPSTPGNAIRLLKCWPLPQYSRLVVRRLKAIARWEPDPRLVPYVIDAWSRR